MHSSHNARAGLYSWMQSATARILRPATVMRTHCPPKRRHRAKCRGLLADRHAGVAAGLPHDCAGQLGPGIQIEETMLSRCVPFSGLQIHRAREKNVVFEMHMLMKVCVEFLGARVESPKSGAAALGRRVGAADPAILLHQSSATIVLFHHGVIGFLYRAKEGSLD